MHHVNVTVTVWSTVTDVPVFSAGDPAGSFGDLRLPRCVLAEHRGEGRSRSLLLAHR
jgi:hypothetical protein